MTTYYVGSKVRLTGTFTVSSTNTDPTTVKVRVKKPDGTITAYTYVTDAEVVKSATGIYYIDVTLTLGGTWTYRWEGTGTVVAASEATVTAQYSTILGP